MSELKRLDHSAKWCVREKSTPLFVPLIKKGREKKEERFMYYSYPQKTELVVVPLQTGRSVREKKWAH